MAINTRSTTPAAIDNQAVNEIRQNDAPADTPQEATEVQDISNNLNNLIVTDKSNNPVQEDVEMADAPATVGSADVLLTDEQVLAKMNQDRAAMSLKMRTLYSRGSSITDEEQILCHELATSIKRLSETMNSYAIGLEPVTTSIRKGTEASKYAHQPRRMCSYS